MDTLPLITSPRPLVPGTHMGLRAHHDRLRPGDRVAVISRPFETETPPSAVRVGTVARIDRVRTGSGGYTYLDAAGELLVTVTPSGERDRAAVAAVDPEEPRVPAGLLQRVQAALRAYMAAQVEAGASGDIDVGLSEDPVTASHEVASHLRISWPEVQELLESGSVRERLGRALLVLQRETGLLRSLLGGKGTR